jgi:hypothetical protein
LAWRVLKTAALAKLTHPPPGALPWIALRMVVMLPIGGGSGSWISLLDGPAVREQSRSTDLAPRCTWPREKLGISQSQKREKTAAIERTADR